MTIEKAIEIISYHKILVNRDKSGLLEKDLEYKAIDLAIEALRSLSVRTQRAYEDGKKDGYVQRKVEETLEKTDKTVHHISLTDDDIEIFQAYIEDVGMSIAFGNSDWNEVYDKIVVGNWSEYAKSERKYYAEIEG
jgi:hypothetical protein